MSHIEGMLLSHLLIRGLTESTLTQYIWMQQELSPYNSYFHVTESITGLAEAQICELRNQGKEFEGV